MKFDFKKLLLVILVASLSSSMHAQNKKVTPKPFSFFVFGDIPYNNPTDEVKFQNLISAINTVNPAFSIHVGDIKSGSSLCVDDYYVKVLGYFGLFAKPLIYTPGDNDWTDCHREKAGGYDPVERLAYVRKIFFKEARSFGKESIPLISQSTNPRYASYVENYRWDYNDVTFATIHVVGSNNNFLPDYKGFNKEFYERDAANIAWLEETFKHAKEAGSLGTVLVVHADMFYNTDGGTGFINFLANLSKLVGQYDKPVLLINGDSHKYVVDKPLMKDAKSKFALLNFTRLMVFGETEQQAIKVTINPSSPNLFEINQFILEENK